MYIHCCSGLLLLKELCGGHLTGAQLHSPEVCLRPNQILGGSFNFDIKTAG